MSTDDLVQWLREQIAEDRAAALACAGAPWSNDVPGMVHVDPAAIREQRHALRQLGYVARADNSPIGDAYRAHIVRHDPRAALDQCKAHTAILDAYTNAAQHRDSNNPVSFTRALTQGYTQGLEVAVRSIGWIYQHRPGYREEWRP